MSFLLDIVLAVISGAAIFLWLSYLSTDLVAAYCAVGATDDGDVLSVGP